MPYFVYEITPLLQLTFVESKEKYRDARSLVRELRKKPLKEKDLQYRMIFANSRGEAEKLLSTPRDERVIGED